MTPGRCWSRVMGWTEGLGDGTPLCQTVASRRGGVCAGPRRRQAYADHVCNLSCSPTSHDHVRPIATAGRTSCGSSTSWPSLNGWKVSQWREYSRWLSDGPSSVTKMCLTQVSHDDLDSTSCWRGSTARGYLPRLEHGQATSLVVARQMCSVVRDRQGGVPLCRQGADRSGQAHLTAGRAVAPIPRS